MSYEEFKQLIDEDKIDQIRTYVDNNYLVMSQLQPHTNDIYDHLLKYCLLDYYDSKEVMSTKYPWKYFIDMELKGHISVEDLGPERMTGLRNSSVYYNLVRLFLQDHNVSDFPESFLAHVTELDSDYGFKMSILIGQSCNYNFGDFWKKQIKGDLYLKIIELLILLHNRHTSDVSWIRSVPKMSHTNYYETQTNVFMSMASHLYMYYNITGRLYSQKVTPDNVIELFLNLSKEEIADLLRQNHFILNLCHYFEWMSISEQLAVWSILSTLEENELLRIIQQSSSDIFIQLAFENLDILKNINQNELPFQSKYNIEYHYVKYVSKIFPETQKIFVIYFFLNDKILCNELFPDFTNQEIIFILKERFNL